MFRERNGNGRTAGGRDVGLSPVPPRFAPMPLRCLPMHDVPDAEKAAWAALQAELPFADSPFFRPEFVECAAAAHGGVEVALLEGGGWLPFHRDHRGVARGAAGHLSDFEGGVIRPDAGFDAAAFVREAGLKAWRFHHLVGGHPGSAPHAMTLADNPYVDLAGGYEAYRNQRRDARSRLFKELGRKARKAERTHEVLFTLDDRDPAALDWLIEHKRRQLRAMRVWDYFNVPWTVPLFRECCGRRGRDFAGLVSTLRHDGRVVAAHLGLRSRGVLHAWTHVFDAEAAALSPGMVMLCRLFEAAANDGVTRVDLGRGHEGYKARFASGTTPLAEGAVERSALPRLAQRAFYFGRDAVAESRLGPPFRRIVRKTRDAVRTLRWGGSGAGNGSPSPT